MFNGAPKSVLENCIQVGILGTFRASEQVRHSSRSVSLGARPQALLRNNPRNVE